MIGYRYAVIGVLMVTHSGLSQDMNCTSVTMACPSAAQWTGRGKQFNCTGNRRYVCLMASNSELREGCIFNSTIPPGRIGCPNIDRCDDLTGQPLLVTEQHYLPCPPDFSGCPPYNHSGYSILEIYKYPACQRRHISEESSFSPDEVTLTATTIPPAGIPRYKNWTIITCITVGTILAAITIIVLVFRKKKDFMIKTVFLDVETENVENIAPKTRTVYSNTQYDVSCIQDCTREKTKMSTRERTFIARPSDNKESPPIPLTSAEAQVSEKQRKHDTTEQTSQISSVEARIPIGPQYIVQKSLEEIDSDIDYFVNVDDKRITTTTVPSYPGKDVSESIQSISRLETKDLTTNRMIHNTQSLISGTGSVPPAVLLNQQLVSKNSEYLHRGYQRSSWSSWDSHGSESPILKRQSSPICQIPSGHNPISSSQTGPYNPYLELLVTGLICSKGSTQEGNENIEELKRRLEASTMENMYLKNKIKHLEEVSGLCADIEAEFGEKGDSSSEISA